MKKKPLYPAALKKNDLIGIMAPSSRTNRARLEKTKEILESKGYRVLIHPQTYKQHGQSAGTSSEKVKALHTLFKDPDIKAIFLARGGNRAGYMLEDLDYNLIKKNPKIVLGYSDVTALLNGIYKHTGLVTFHGPTASSFSGDLRPADAKQCFNLLSGKAEDTLPLTGAKIMRKGTAQGPLIGGNLSLLSSLAGTPYMPDLKGAILFIEDCTDELSRFDRMFLHLRNAGVFNQISGLVVGHFTDVTDTGSQPFGFTINEIIEHATAGKRFPIVINAPFGHGDMLATYPVGAPAKLTATGKKPALRLTGPAVK